MQNAERREIACFRSAFCIHTSAFLQTQAKDRPGGLPRVAGGDRRGAGEGTRTNEPTHAPDRAIGPDIVCCHSRLPFDPQASLAFALSSLATKSKGGLTHPDESSNLLSQCLTGTCSVLPEPRVGAADGSRTRCCRSFKPVLLPMSFHASALFRYCLRNAPSRCIGRPGAPPVNALVFALCRSFRRLRAAKRRYA